ncbi:metallopeptidase family protein [Nitratireductor sp. XY-223]|uniref:metallopeptidase family protein n=1 Tax=Nitratireductor sp. XY-223 TaxID=2561926 RepID=UPI0010AB2828|nr:metallopeptidase family protein [Nitratireductor sp. XY-223]
MESASPWTGRLSPSLADFERLGQEAFDGLPQEFRSLCSDIQITVADFAEKDVLKSLDLASPFDLLGLFQGIGMAQGATEIRTGQMPNRIWLYRRAILEYWIEREESLDTIVRHVLIHEIGHHFGLSDDDMEAIEAEAD